MYACVYHGDEPMCQVGSTRPKLQDTTENAVWHWNENIEFDIDVKDLPRGSRLCLGIYAVYGGKAKKQKKANKEVRKEE